MKPLKITTFVSLCILLVTSCAMNFSANNDESPKQAHLNASDKVRFPVSCSKLTQTGIEQGLTLFHHMMYVEAEKVFTSLVQKESECAMAHWGIAITLFHPLWPGQTRDAALKKGWDAIQNAKALKPLSQREFAFIKAVEALYKNWKSETQKNRVLSWAIAQKELYQQYPDNTEAAVFYALSHLAIAPKGDRSFSHQKQAGALLEKLYKDHPKHPGVLHYTIHAYDNPLLAKRGINAANAYNKIAPEVPHALHMPTHIFVRLGNWDKVIDLNARSAKAALNYSIKGTISHHNPHALDYQMYAHLQRAEDNRAQQILNKLQSTDNYQKTFVSGYALAAIPARYHLERRQWKKAAQLSVRQPSSFPWEKYPEVEAITHFARGFGAIKSGNTTTTKKAIAELEALHKRTVTVGQQYWTVIIDAQGKTLKAWLALKRGNNKLGILLMSQAATLEDSVNKHPVTPGAVLPAREIFADMLMLTKDYAKAFENYEASLKISPNRLNSLEGAGRAAKKLGKEIQAKIYYSKLNQLTENANGNRPIRN